MRIAVIGNSLCTRNNGISAVCWPHLMEHMIRDGGVSGVTIHNFSVPGLKWKSAFTPTAGFLIGGTQTPVGAFLANGPFDLVLLMNASNDAIQGTPTMNRDYQDFRAALGSATPVGFVREDYYITGTTISQNCIVTDAQAAALDIFYQQITEPFYGVNLGKLHEMGFNYDKLHPDLSGKQLIASSVYMGLMAQFGWTPIVRNIAFMYEMYLNNRTVFDQMSKVNR